MKKPSLEDKLLAAQIEKAHQAIAQQSTQPVQIEKKEVEIKEKNVRVTVDMPESMHEALKYRIIKEKKSIREFILMLLEKELNA